MEVTRTLLSRTHRRTGDGLQDLQQLTDAAASSRMCYQGSSVARSRRLSRICAVRAVKVFRLRTPSTRKDPKRPAVQTCEAAFTGKADQQRSVRLAS
ncbi:uncharacterized protein [Dermacentor albipictus]|uniref:uncharacterized protein isoform X1 n=1 Tax=Dermacentor albipictus TaxID=60249 RepID=UPI0038FC95BF